MPNRKDEVRALANQIEETKSDAGRAWAAFDGERKRIIADGVDLAKDAKAREHLQRLSDAYDAKAREVSQLEGKRGELLGGHRSLTKSGAPVFLTKAADRFMESKEAGGSSGVRLDAADVFADPAARYLSQHLPNVDAAEFVQEYIKVGTPTQNAAPVAEGALKPVSVPNVSRERSEFSTVAHVGTVPNQMVFDHASAMEVINELMIEGLMIALDDQIVNGDGTGENLLGLLNTPGIAGITQGGAESPLDAVLRASTTVRLNRGIASLLVVSPDRWLDLATTKDANGNYQVGSPEDATELRLWGHRVCVTEALADTTGLVLDPIKAGMANKTGIDLEWNQYSGEAFQRNQFAYRAEWRGTLQVMRPAHVCEITFV